MLRIYVMGAYSDPNIINVQANMRRGINLAIRVARSGMLPYCPWLDFNYGLITDMPMPVYKRLSLEELRNNRHAGIVTTGSENSEGTHDERREASIIGIPVFEEANYAEFICWAMQQPEYPIDEEYRRILEHWNATVDYERLAQRFVLPPQIVRARSVNKNTQALWDQFPEWMLPKGEQIRLQETEPKTRPKFLQGGTFEPCPVCHDDAFKIERQRDLISENMSRQFHCRCCGSIFEHAVSEGEATWLLRKEG